MIVQIFVNFDIIF